MALLFHSSSFVRIHAGSKLVYCPVISADSHFMFGLTMEPEEIL